MRESTTQRRVGDGRPGSGPRSFAEVVRREWWKAILPLVLVPPVAFVAIRMAWDQIMLTVVRGAADDWVSVEIFATTPFSVIIAQVGLAAFVGLVLSIEWLAYAARRELLPEGWWAGGPLARWMRRVLVAVGFALFAVGAALGFLVVAPAVAATVIDAGATVAVVRLIALLTLVAIATGLAVQGVYVATVLALSRLRRTDAAGRDGN